MRNVLRARPAEPTHRLLARVLRLADRAHDTEDAPLLAQALSAVEWVHAPTATVRATVARALGRIAHAAGVPALRTLTQDDNASVRRAAMTALASIAPESIEAVLLSQTRAARWPERRAAARYLAHVETSAAHFRLYEMMTSDRSAGVRRAAALALAAHGDMRCLRHRCGVNQLTARFLKMRDGDGLSSLRSHPEKWVRRALVRALGRGVHVAKAARPHLRMLLADEDPDIRLEAACLLAKYEPQLVQAYEAELMAAGDADRVRVLWDCCPVLAQRYLRLPTDWEIRVCHIEHERGLDGLIGLLDEAETPPQKSHVLMRCAVHHARNYRDRSGARQLLSRARRLAVDEYDQLAVIRVCERLIDDALRDAPHAANDDDYADEP